LQRFGAALPCAKACNKERGKKMESTIKSMNDAFEQSFMKPQCFMGSDIQEELMHSGLDVEDDGFYGRLSANGYLSCLELSNDCTDWSGPFSSVKETAEFLIETYAD
jgi:hypothetical protein